MMDEGEVLYENLDSSTSNSSNSSHITEEDLIDTLFHSCDLHNEGVVPVSRIIEHLQFVVVHSAVVSITCELESIYKNTYNREYEPRSRVLESE